MASTAFNPTKGSAFPPLTPVPAAETPAPRDEETFFARWHLAIATGLTLLFLVLGWGLGAAGLISAQAQVIFYLLAYITGGTFATRDALHSLFVQRTIDIDLLMIFVAVGAAIIGHWPEGATLLFLFSLGNTLEHFAMGRTYRAVRALMDLRPEDALVNRNGVEQRVPVVALALGEMAIVKPGDRIPVDGVVASGSSAVNQAPITGESIPVDKTVGDDVFAGTINGTGALYIRMTRPAQESTLAKIITIVEQAQAEKSAAQRFTDRFEGWYAGGIIAFAALVWLVPVIFLGQDISASFYRAMVLLVVASPCALVISTPAATLSALANAARSGILFKGAAHLEQTGAIKVVAFDKTGTLTGGKPMLTDIVTHGTASDATVLHLAASVERLSEHPLAQALVNGARERGIVPTEPDGVTAIVGRGVRGKVDSHTILIGNEALLTDSAIAITREAHEAVERLREEGKTTIFVADATTATILGTIGVADTVRPVARQVVAALKALGVARTVMLTGDNERAARAIARAVGIDEVRAGLLPEEKLRAIKGLRETYGPVAMVGDGVNDAPALAAASVGIAMGAAGSDAALETADVILMADDLTKLPYAIALSRRARRAIRQNLTFALGVIAILVIAALGAHVPLPLGVIGHEGSTIVVVANGLRLLVGRAPAVTTASE
jgi:Cd2+/Zn2+-exporting ATPase